MWTFPGFVKNPYAFLARASLFTLSSRYESLSNVLMRSDGLRLSGGQHRKVYD